MRDGLPHLIWEELTAAHVDFHVVNGGKHRKLFVMGRFVGVYSKGNCDKNNRGDKGCMNLRAQVRRAIREFA